MHKSTDQRGVLLLIGLVMTMVLLVSSAILATIVIRETRVSGLVDRGIVALYGGETSSESAVYQIFKLGVEPTDLDGTSGSSPSGGTWSRVARDSADEFIFDFLVPGSEKELVIYNRDNPGQASNATGLALSWSNTGRVEFDVYDYDGANLNYNSSGSFSGSSGTINLSGGVHQVLLRADDVLTDFTARTLPLGTIVSIPVTVTVLGEYEGSEQAIELTLPVAPPWNQPAAICGNGTVESGEQCDDGNTTPGDGCDASCQTETVTVCGDSVVETGEQCDDGNTANGDGCSSTCQFEGAVCGNGSVEVPEICDDGDAGNTGTCNATCTAFTTCGDGVVQAPNGNPGANEQCDDGNTTPGDGCDASCQTEAPAVCGNGSVEAGEQCDDGSTQNGDGCSSTCQIEPVQSTALFSLSGSITAIGVNQLSRLYIGRDGRVEEYNTDGVFIRSTSPLGGTIHGISVNPAGEVYVSYGANQLTRYNSSLLSGTALNSNGRSGRIDHNSANDQIVIADPTNQTVTAINSSGTLVWEVTVGSNISDIEVRGSDILISRDTAVSPPGSAMVRLDHSGNPLFISGGYAFSKAVASHTSDKFWVSFGSSIQLYTALGNPSVSDSGYSSLSDLSYGNNGSFIYGIDSGTGEVFQFGI